MEHFNYLKKDLIKLLILVVILVAAIIAVAIWDKNSGILQQIAQKLVN